MAQEDDIKRTGRGGGMDTDSAFEDIAPEDAINRVNLRNTGSKGQDLGYDTNIESTIPLTGPLLPGINNVIGGGGFYDTGQILGFRYNTAGNCQMILYDFASNTYKVIFTDVTNSGGQTLLPLNPQNEVLAILINKTYVIWWAKDLEVGYCNLNTLASGGYGTVLWEDLSLLKPQCPIPISHPVNVTTPDVIISGFGSDAGQPVNNLYSRLPQFTVQGINADYNYSAWSTWSKRFTPYQENTPTLGAAVSQNNYIVLAVYIWSTRLITINIAAQFDDSRVFSIIKSVDTSHIYALQNTSVDVSTEIYEAYDPSTSTYYFVFYNNTVTIPVNPNETDLLFDPIWPSNAGALLNGNIPALGDWKTLYQRPVIPVTVKSVGYSPNITIPANHYSNPLVSLGSYPGASGSGAGNHKRIMWIAIAGSPNTGDVVAIITADIRNATATRNLSYTVPAAQSGNLLAVVTSISQIVGGTFVAYGSGYMITWTDVPYYGLQTYSIELFFGGATVANSVPTVLDNASYQVAIAYFDYKGRPFPLTTDGTYIVANPSYAQQNGNATEIVIQINLANAPVGAVRYQILITKPRVLKVLDVISTIITYKGAWDASTNTPGLSINSGNIGDTYPITTPASPAYLGTYHNLGHNDTYNTGDYITNVGGTSGGSQAGQYYAVLPKTFGNLATNQGGILVFSLNSLSLLNAEYSQENVKTNLVYDFAQGDRCTLHYWIDPAGAINYFNNPCIDLAVLGYDAGTYLVKVENSAALTFSGGHILYNGFQIDVRNIFIRLYSPAPQTGASSATLNETEWFEIGEQYPIINGQHSQLNITITDGGAYYKTRTFPDAIQPYTNPPIQVLATDLNYSDYYPSAYYSFGRVRTYYDILEQSEQQALIITGQPYISGSKINGINRFFPSHVYGNSNGQTSSSQGSIQIMDQVGQTLRIMQERGVFYTPINEAYTVLNAELTGQSISSVLLNNGRYDTEDVGIGLTKGYCRRYSISFFTDPNKSLPYRIVNNKVESIAGKMSKYFKSILQLAYSQGKKIQLMYNDNYEEVMLTIQADGGQLYLFPFSTTNWNPFNNYTIIPGQVSATPNGAHCTASYNATTGKVTYTPAANYVGNDVATFTFNPGSGNITLNNCLNWTLGSGNVNPFSFMALTGVPLGTVELSNTIYVTGNDYPVAISISGSTGLGYSINGGAFTSSAGTVNNGDTVQVRVTSSGSINTLTSCTLSIDGQSATFNVTSRLAGNFTAYAQYGGTIVSIQNGTGTGVPAGYNPCNLTPGQSQSAAYATLTTGTYSLALTGSPVLPGHTQVFLSVNGVVADFKPFTGGGSYTLTLGVAANDPDAVVFSFRNV